MAGRFIKLYENILKWEWYGDINTSRLFIHLLLIANYKDCVFRGQVIKRGQVVRSVTNLASETRLTVRQVRDSLKHLKMTNEVTSSSCPRYTVFTIVKYDDYQASDKPNDKQVTNKVTNKRQTERQTNDKQNDNEYRIIEYIEHQKDRNIDSPTENTSPAVTPSNVAFDFDVFWNCYPRKIAKADAMKAWKAIKVDEGLMVKIMAGLKAWIASDQWSRDDGKYIPYPATWLRQRRWEDEVQAPASTRKIVAQNYEQRDYGTLQDEIMERQRRRIEERLRRQNERDYSDVPDQLVNELGKEIEQAKKEGII